MQIKKVSLLKVELLLQGCPASQCISYGTQKAIGQNSERRLLSSMFYFLIHLPFIHPSIHLSICPSSTIHLLSITHLPIYPSIHPLSIHSSTQSCILPLTEQFLIAVPHTYIINLSQSLSLANAKTQTKPSFSLAWMTAGTSYLISISSYFFLYSLFSFLYPFE